MTVYRNAKPKSTVDYTNTTVDLPPYCSTSTGADVFVVSVGIHWKIQYSGRQTGNTYIKIQIYKYT